MDQTAAGREDGQQHQLGAKSGDGGRCIHKEKCKHHASPSNRDDWATQRQLPRSWKINSGNTAVLICILYYFYDSIIGGKVLFMEMTTSIVFYMIVYDMHNIDINLQ